jgi:hypothetical protein
MVVIYLVFLLTLVGFAFGMNHIVEKNKGEPDLIVLTDTLTVYVDSSKTHKMFLEDIGKFESNNNYRKVNRFGYMGKYQFGRGTLKEVGVVCTPQEFIDQPMLQEHAMELYLLYNKKQLSEFIGKYQFTKFRGIYITESGVLAAAHLGGAGSVKLFFKGGKVFQDGNGVPITTYMKEFGGYNLIYK